MAHLPAAEDVDVEMEDELTAVRSVIGDDAIALRFRPRSCATLATARQKPTTSSAGAAAQKSACETYSPWESPAHAPAPAG